MKITYYTHKPEESKTRRVQVGSKLIGIRLLTATIESQKELDELLSDKGIEWAGRNMRFKLEPTTPLKDTAEVAEVTMTDNRRESNWGSDWVDDGV